MDLPARADIRHGHVGLGRRLDLAAEAPAQGWLLTLAERGATVHVPAGWSSVWVLLRGEVQAGTAFVGIGLGRGDMLGWSDGPLQLGSHRDGWLLGLAAPTALWRPGPTRHWGRPRLVHSRRCPATRDVRRLLVRLGRACRAGTGATPVLLQSLLDAVYESQADLETWLQRCSGQNPARKEYTLQRLLRARNVLEHSHGVTDGIAHLADIARFSVTHFKRTYRDVFGISPGEHALQLRTAHTWKLVTSTSLPISDVCEAVGFESKSAFCRTFRRSFGITTSEARARGRPALAGA